MFEIRLIKKPIDKAELQRIAESGFGDLVKAVVDVAQEIIGVGGELHADEEVWLMEQYGSKREDTWGINIYPAKPRGEMIEFDSIVNIKPSYGNHSPDIESPEVKQKIKDIVERLIKE